MSNATSRVRIFFFSFCIMNNNIFSERVAEKIIEKSFNYNGSTLSDIDVAGRPWVCRSKQNDNIACCYPDISCNPNRKSLLFYQFKRYLARCNVNLARSRHWSGPTPKQQNINIVWRYHIAIENKIYLLS